MNVAALAICGAALGGGMIAVSSELPIGVFVALAALPLLTLAEPGTSGIGIGELGIAATGLAAAGIAGWLARRDNDPTNRHAEPGAVLEPAIATGALVLAAAAAAVAGFAAANPPGGGIDARATTLGVGLGLAVAAVPLAVLAGAHRRLVGLAVGVAGAGLVDRAIGPWTPAVALAGPALGAVVASALTPEIGGRLARAGDRALALDLPSPSRLVERTSELLDRRVLGVAVVVAPLVIGGGALVALWGGATAGGGVVGGGFGDASVARAVTLLVGVGGIGTALLAVSDAVAGGDADPVVLLPTAAAIPVGALALRLTDPIGAVLLAGVAGIVGSAAARGSRSSSIIAGTTLLAGCGLVFASSTFAVGFDGRSLGTLLVALAIAGRVGAIPFHRAAAGAAGGTLAGSLGIGLAWLPAVMVVAALGGASGVPIAGTGGTAVHPTAAPDLVGFERLLVLAAGMTTVVLGGLAGALQENIRRAVTYVVISQAGWLVVAAASPGDAGPEAIEWLPAFVAGSLLLGGVAGLLTPPGRSAPGVANLAGFGRSNPVALLALVVAVVALAGIPGTPAWTARATIASSAVGTGADALVAFGIAAMAVGVGRLIVLAARAQSSWAGRARAGATGRLRLVADGAIAALSVGTLAVALGLLR